MARRQLSKRRIPRQWRVFVSAKLRGIAGRQYIGHYMVNARTPAEARRRAIAQAKSRDAARAKRLTHWAGTPKLASR